MKPNERKKNIYKETKDRRGRAVRVWRKMKRTFGKRKTRRIDGQEMVINRKKKSRKKNVDYKEQ